MVYRLFRGFHFAFPMIIGFHRGKTQQTHTVIFHESCRYTPDSENDWNKLFGWSYGWHHKNSVRVGWRYRPDLDKIEICIYSYDEGIRKVSERTLLVHIGFEYDYFLCVETRGDRYMLHMESIGLLTLVTNRQIKPTWGYNLGLYFGGQARAPHTIIIKQQKI